MTGYDPDFLGIHLPLPTVGPSREADVLVNDGTLDNGVLANYPNYAVVTDRRRRAPLYVVAHIDQTKFKDTTRSNNWKLDQRVGSDFQLDNAYYANNPWDKGHIAMRDSQGWGATPRVAQKAADETFYYSNACLQHENLNQDEWLALEIWVNELNLARNGKITVFAGPVYGEFLRTIRPTSRPEADIPSGFWKVVCFVNDQTGQLDVRAFYMLQDQQSMRDKNGRDTFEFQNYQVTVTEVENLTGLTFPPDVAEANPLFFNANARARGATSFPERVDIDRPQDMIHTHDQPRVPVLDDQVEVYIAAAMVDPPGEDQGNEWVSLINLEDRDVDIEGWRLVDGADREKVLDGVLAPGQARSFRGPALAPVRLPNSGGVITLLDAQGERIDRADYNLMDIARKNRKKKDKTVPLIFFTYREKEPAPRVR